MAKGESDTSSVSSTPQLIVKITTSFLMLLKKLMKKLIG